MLEEQPSSEVSSPSLSFDTVANPPQLPQPKEALHLSLVQILPSHPRTPLSRLLASSLRCISLRVGTPACRLSRTLLRPHR